VKVQGLKPVEMCQPRRRHYFLVRSGAGGIQVNSIHSKAHRLCVGCREFLVCRGGVAKTGPNFKWRATLVYLSRRPLLAMGLMIDFSGSSTRADRQTPEQSKAPTYNTPGATASAGGYVGWREQGRYNPTAREPSTPFPFLDLEEPRKKSPGQWTGRNQEPQQLRNGPQWDSGSSS
jgi:hypothetical protein